MDVYKWTKIENFNQAKSLKFIEIILLCNGQKVKTFFNFSSTFLLRDMKGQLEGIDESKIRSGIRIFFPFFFKFFAQFFDVFQNFL